MHGAMVSREGNSNNNERREQDAVWVEYEAGEVNSRKSRDTG